jgi:hypothetical protein
MIKLMNRFLNSYSAERDRTNATAMPPLIPPMVRIFCHLTGILTLKILRKVLPPYTTTALDNIMMPKGATMIRIRGNPTLSAVSTESKGIPIRKNSTLFVMKPR